MLLAAGCEADLGACDESAARTLVYASSDGSPAYAGQTLVNGTCASGYCHSATATNDETRPLVSQVDLRHGVPGGFDFDLDTLTVFDARALEMLREDQARIVGARADIWDAIQSEDMPRILPLGDPSGGLNTHEKFAEAEWAFGRATREAPRVLVPRLDSAEGKEIVRNWLACGAPLVDRLEGIALPPGVAAVGDPASRDPFGPCRSDADCTDSTDRCYLGVRVDLDSTLGECGPQPEWPDLFTKVIAVRCAVSGCHGGLNPPTDLTMPTGMMLLDPGSSDVSYDDLVAVTSMGPMCVDEPRTRVIAGDVVNSLLIKKLEGNGTPDSAECGDRMPQGGPYLGPGTIEAFRQWIAAGALRVPPP